MRNGTSPGQLILQLGRPPVFVAGDPTATVLLDVTGIQRQRALGFAQCIQHRTIEAREGGPRRRSGFVDRSEEHTSELQLLMRISYAGFCLKQNKTVNRLTTNTPKN